MTNLKELTWKIHQQAERSTFARKLLKGLEPNEYYRYLYNQYMIYSVLELYVDRMYPELSDILREKHIYNDMREIAILYNIVPGSTTLCPVVPEYEKHLATLDPKGILAHVYVRHFGDMYGGQMIKKRNPGSGTMYDFNQVDELKAKVRSMISDDMAEEANRCFEFAIQLFKELENE